ncbi:transposase family protein [Spirillospora sp. NBC_01491]|uniref:transposase family protein n=1 Tax=Spirillospora sp. NBC_01491 TaxID=2976007 RepID=UPI002E37A03F|nr:transposase family protein [Spirillospora sp. NBC_01491]
MLVHLRRNDTFARLAAVFGIGAATAHRYITEVIALLADRAPDLREAMRIAQRKAFVILDGTLAPIDRLSGLNDRLHCSGKHHRRGMNIQFLTDPNGELIRASSARPDT